MEDLQIDVEKNRVVIRGINNATGNLVSNLLVTVAAVSESEVSYSKTKNVLRFSNVRLKNDEAKKALMEKMYNIVNDYMADNQLEKASSYVHTMYSKQSKYALSEKERERFNELKA